MGVELMVAEEAVNVSSSRDAGDDKYLTFEVCGQVYGIATRCIREVVPYGVISQVGDVPEFLLGVTNLRHEVIAVVDLQLLFGGSEATERDIHTCFLIVMFDDGDGVERPIGLVVRRIYSAREILAEDIDGPPVVGGWAQVDYLAGLGKGDEGVMILLDVGRLLGPTEATIRKVMGGGGGEMERVGDAARIGD